MIMGCKGSKIPVGYVTTTWRSTVALHIYSSLQEGSVANLIGLLETLNESQLLELKSEILPTLPLNTELLSARIEELLKLPK